MKTLNSIEVLENGVVQVRYQNAGKFERISLYPGQDTSAQLEAVQSFCASVWTAEVIAAYEAEAKRDVAA